MATSGSYDFAVTRNNIIRDALLAIHALDAEESTIPTTALTDASRLLNMMVKGWQTKYNLWRFTDITIPLHSSKQSYTIGTSGVKNTQRPMRITHARRQDTSGYEIPIFVDSLQEYKDLSIKSTTGPVARCAYDPQLTNGTLYVWPVQNTALTSLSDGSTDLWTDSPTTPGEYYYTGAAITAEPTYVFANGIELIPGTIGSLASGEWAYGDQDSLGADTVYIKAASDPDGQATNYVQCLTSTPVKLIVTAQRPVMDFDSTADNPDFPIEWAETIVYNLAVRLCGHWGKQVPPEVAAIAQSTLADLEAFDSENTSIFIQPGVD